MPTVRKATNVALVATALVLAWTATQQWKSQAEFRAPGIHEGNEFPSLALIGLSGDTVDVDFGAESGIGWSSSIQSIANTASGHFPSTGW